MRTQQICAASPMRHTVRTKSPYLPCFDLLASGYVANLLFMYHSIENMGFWLLQGANNTDIGTQSRTV